MEEHLFITYLHSPRGILKIKGTDTFISSILFVEEEKESSTNLPEIILQCKKELDEYFAGSRKEFAVKLAPEGTDFRKRVWQKLLEIKFAETISYLTVSKQLGDDKAIRAVGSANGKNPIAIIIPCHRVISEDGKLTGYAGGLWRKQWLLEHEGNISGRNRTLF